MAIDKIILDKNEPIAKSCFFLLSERMDIIMCQEIIDELESLHQNQITSTEKVKLKKEIAYITSLTYTLIVTYMKLFNSPQRTGFNDKKLYKNNKRLLTLHSIFSDLRNKLVSHGDNFEDGEIQNIYSIMLVDEDSPEGHKWAISVDSDISRALNFKVSMYSEIKQMLDIVFEQWNIKYNNHLSALVKIYGPIHLANLRAHFSQLEYDNTLENISTGNIVSVDSDFHQTEIKQKHKNE